MTPRTFARQWECANGALLSSEASEAFVRWLEGAATTRGAQKSSSQLEWGPYPNPTQIFTLLAHHDRVGHAESTMAAPATDPESIPIARLDDLDLDEDRAEWHRRLRDLATARLAVARARDSNDWES